MFDNFANKKIMMVLPMAAALVLFGCKEDEATAAPAPEPVNLAQTEDLFSEPVKANPLTSDPSAVVVRVNGEDITRGEITELMNAAMQQMAGRVQPQQMQQLQGRMYEQIKNDLITKKLIDAAIAEAKVAATDDEVTEAIDSIRKRIPEGKTLEEAVAAQGSSMDELKKNIKSDITTRKFLETKTEGIADATEAEAKEFYDANPDQFKKPENVTASHILIKFEDTDTDETKAAKKDILNKIRKDIIDGKISFADAAKEHSGDPGSASNGGEYKNIPRGQMVPEFEIAAFTQEIGEVGDVVETQYGYHIIKVAEHSEEGTVSFEEAKEQIITYLSGQKKQKAVQDFIKSLRDAATIEEITI